jgi:glycosyltransferase involved in cell wall biosynthesis
LPTDLAAGQPLHVALDTTAFVPRDAGAGADFRELGIALAALQVVGVGLSSWLDRRTSDPLDFDTAFAEMVRHRTLPAAAGYGTLLAISRYTQDWIERRWKLSSRLIYPPVDVDDLRPGTKRPIILSVGRFFAGSHNKKHLPMIEAFRRLCDDGLRGWEYHLAGGSDQASPDQQAYLRQVRAAAEGYPIIVHANAPYSELRDLYATAAIFWHATGFGEDEKREPEHFEHFGISTVEAMAAGCAPVVIARAGQIEIVEPGISGLLWSTLDELQSYTSSLISDPALRDRISHAARHRSQDFGMARFEREVKALVAEVGNRG